MNPLYWRTVLAVLCILIAASDGSAQMISWDPGYPKAGMAKGTIAVAGTIALPMSYKFESTTVAIRAWQDGGQVFSASAKIKGSGPYTWSGSIAGLVPGATYNVTVEATVRAIGGAVSKIVSDAKLANAK